MGDVRRGSIAATLLGLTALIAACSPTGVAIPPAEVITESESLTPVDKTTAPPPEIDDAWPLTGSTEDVTDRVVMSIKVENSAQSRPQTGLQEADLVWEQMIEGGYTRFVAMYQSQVPDVVGPIRSMRPMDIPVASPFGGQLIFSGAQQGFLNLANASNLQILTHDNGNAGFSRGADRPAPHNVYGDTSTFLDQASGDADVPDAFDFAPEPEFASAVMDGEEASRIEVNFPSTEPRWDWDSDSGTWLRSEGAEAATTTDSGRIGAVNVLVLRMEVRNTEYRDPSGAPVPETIVAGSGQALIATGGQVITGEWTKGEEDEVIRLRDEDGQDIYLAAGNTWIEMLPTDDASVSWS